MKENKLYFNKYVLLNKILIIVILILALPSLAIMSPSPCCIFGSKVIFEDADIGYPLNYCCHNLGFNDIGRERNVYDENDPVYLDMDANGIISNNDIRITPFVTPFAIYMPGSKATRTDIDINAPLINFSNWSISYIDLNGDKIYGLGDSFYLHDRNRGNQIISGDIRLTFFEAHKPSTRVLNFNADANLSCTDLMGVNTPNRSARSVGIRFFNVNGNYINGSAVYDRPDTVYLHIFKPNESTDVDVIGFVGPNDLRLSL